MKKNTGKQPETVSKLSEGINKNGRKLIAAGIVLLTAGFLLLTRTDPGGQNWASTVSPFMIVAAYIAIAVGIVFPDDKPAGKK